MDNGKSLSIKIEVVKPERKVYKDSSHFDKMTPTQKLDATLETLDIYSKTINEVQEALKLPLNTATFNEVEIILDKLKVDQHIKEYKADILKYEGIAYDNPKKLGELTYYKITFEGKVFKDKGGYSKKYKSDKWVNFPKNKWYIYDIGKVIAGAIIGAGITLLIEHTSQTKKPQTDTPSIHLKDTVVGIPHKS